jgi:hypothetical protein
MSFLPQDFGSQDTGLEMPLRQCHIAQSIPHSTPDHSGEPACSSYDLVTMLSVFPVSGSEKYDSIAVDTYPVENVRDAQRMASASWAITKWGEWGYVSALLAGSDGVRY